MFSISIDSSDLKRVVKQLERLQAKMPEAIARGLNEGGDKVRTQVRRAMREQTGLVQLRSVTSRSSTIRAYAVGNGPKDAGPVGRAGPQVPGATQGPAKGANLSYAIVFRGKPSTRPDEFVFRVIKGPGGGVTVNMWGAAHRFKRSFQIAGANKAYGLRMRKGSAREPTRGFDGPNLAKEAVKGQVAKTFLLYSRTLVLPMIEKHLAKALG